MIGTHFHNPISVSDVKDNNVKGTQYDIEITHCCFCPMFWKNDMN
jgi:hypothetical protein